MLQYASVVWSYENIDINERVHEKNLKPMHNLISCTSSYIVCGKTSQILHVQDWSFFGPTLSIPVKIS